MPNPGLHFEIARQAFGSDHPDLLLGAAMDDFRGMYRDRYGQEAGTAPVTLGLAAGEVFHRVTDAEFDSLPLLMHLKTPLVSGLMQEVPRSVARASGAWNDVIVDGVLYEQNRSLVELFGYMAGRVLSNSTSLAFVHPDPRFEALVKGYFERGIPPWYTEPEGLASSLKRRFDQRSVRRAGRGMNITSEHVSPLAEAFEAHLPAARAAAPHLLGQTAHNLRLVRLVSQNDLHFLPLEGVHTTLGTASGHEAQAAFPEHHSAGLTNSLSLAARYLLQRSLRENGQKIRVDPNGDPDDQLRPQGIASSLSHCSATGWTAAAWAHTSDAFDVGVDVEALVSGRKDISRRVLSTGEAEQLPIELERPDLFIASAKEAGYKAVSRLAGNRYIGFKEVFFHKLVSGHDVVLFEAEPLSEQFKREMEGYKVRIAARAVGGMALCVARTSTNK